jgi:hypothetical protein
MDCERFDHHVIDELYDELDELTHAALKRHVDGCSRCSGVYAGLRATREVGVLPLVEPPADLTARILDAVSVAQRQAPWHRRVLRGLAWAGSHAMRPQFAMAALFFLVVGSSLLLLRARPGAVGTARLADRDAPSRERAAAAPAPLAAAPALGGPHAAAKGDGVAEKKGEAPPADQAASADRSADEARAALAEARAVRDASGCAAAVPKLGAVASGYAGTQVAADAMWDQASCYKQMGEAQRAHALYRALRGTGYRDRAEQELAAAATAASAQQAVAAAPAAAPPPATATAAPAAPAAKPVMGGTNPRAPAAPANRELYKADQ